MLSLRQIAVPYTAPQTRVAITCCDKTAGFLGSIFVTGAFHPLPLGTKGFVIPSHRYEKILRQLKVTDERLQQSGTLTHKGRSYAIEIFKFNVEDLGINDVFFHPVENKGDTVCQHTI